MKLLYLYIGHMNRPLDYHEIPFSDDYHIHFDRDEKKLLIQKNPEIKKSIYGDNITDLKLIVGKNGCGKTTILNLLGLTAPDLRREFSQYEDENESWPETALDWFALYHLEDDLFALEGYNSQLLLRTSSYLNNHYSAAVQYDFQTSSLNFLDYLQNFREKETRYKYINQAAYLTYSLEPDCPWYFKSKRQKYEKYDIAFLDRYDISQFNFYGVEHFLYLAAKNAEDFRSLFDSTPAALKVELRLERNEVDSLSIHHEKDRLAEAIYGEGRSFLSVSMPQLEKVFGSHSELSYKHSLIIRYLEELLVYAIKEETIKNAKAFTARDGSEEIKYITRRDFLLDFIEQLTRVQARPETYKDTVIHSYDHRLAKQFCAALEQIPDRFFKSGTDAEIYLRDCETNFLEPLMECYDMNQEHEDHEFNHRGFLSFSIENLSAGELAMIDLYAAILNGVRGWNQAKRNLILLLDEPDSRLHPEWERLFLKRLIDLLKTEPFSGYRFQIIIATHSPLLLSDVPRKDIICLQQSDEGIAVTNANYGFMSNLNDILLDSMFLSSPFGAFAERYTNEIMKQISELKEILSGRPDQIIDLKPQIEILEKKIEIIDDPYIRETLKHSLDSLNLYNNRQPLETRIAFLEKELEHLKAIERAK